MQFPLRALLLLTLLSAQLTAEPVSFQQDIAPILHRRCARCHNEDSNKGGYRLDTFRHLSKTGDSELPAVTPGKAEESELYRLLVEASPEDRMPQKADPLPQEEIEAIRRWLNQGAQNDSDSPDRPIVELARATLLRKAPTVYPRPVPVRAIAFSPDGTRLATNGYYEVFLWRLEDGALERRIGGMPQQITGLSWSPNGEHIAVVGGSPGRWGTTVLVDLKHDDRIRILGDFEETSLTVDFAPDSKSLVVGVGDRTTRFYDVTTGSEKRVLRQHSDWVQAAKFSRDGKHVISASRDRTAKVISVEKGEVEATYTDHDTPLLSAAFLDTSGTRAITSDRSKALHEWDARSGRRRKTMSDFEGEPVELIARDGLVIAGGGSCMLSVHQLSDAKRLFTLYGHHDTVLSMALARHGHVLASGSADGEVLLWDLRCGTWTHRFIASPR